MPHRALLLLLLPTMVHLTAADLGPRLTPLLARVPTGAGVGILVVDLADDSTVFARDADEPLRLASLTKLPVALGALEILGPRYRFQTTVHFLGPLVDGTVSGLGIVGGGDPCLDEHFTERDPDRVFTAWIAALRERGLEHIDGDLVVDGSLFRGPIVPPTYPQDAEDRIRWYSAPASALAWNDNCIEVRVRPGRVGGPAQVEVRPRSSRITVDNRTRTAAAAASRLIVTRAQDANRVIVSGTYAKTTAWYPLAIHSDPDLLAGDHFAALLGDAGIEVTGSVVLGQVPAEAEPVVIQENPLWPALDILNQRSQNFYGEQLLRLYGVRRRDEGSITAGATALRELLDRDLGLPGRTFAIVDGSGLSYANRGSARFVCQVLGRARDRKDGERFVATLKEKWSGKIRCRVKTGTLAVARNLAGYIDLEDRRYAFAIILDRAEAASFSWAVRLRDQLFHEIVRGLAG